ncbi:hypothetical protein SUDANB6_05663 [Streptomyces sp. enrichment culture]
MPPARSAGKGGTEVPTARLRGMVSGRRRWRSRAARRTAVPRRRRGAGPSPWRGEARSSHRRERLRRGWRGGRDEGGFANVVSSRSAGAVRPGGSRPASRTGPAAPEGLGAGCAGPGHVHGEPPAPEEAGGHARDQRSADASGADDTTAWSRLRQGNRSYRLQRPGVPSRSHEEGDGPPAGDRRDHGRDRASGALRTRPRSGRRRRRADRASRGRTRPSSGGPGLRQSEPVATITVSAWRAVPAVSVSSLGSLMGSAGTVPPGASARGRVADAYGFSGAISAIRPSTRVLISSRIGRTASTPRPAGSSSFQSR